VKVFLLVGLLVSMGTLWRTNSYAQACCSGGVPISSNLGLTNSSHRHWQFLATYDLNVLNDLVDNESNLNDDSRKRTTHSTLFEINYGLTERIALTGLLSLVRQEREVTTFSNTEFTSAQGLSDAVLLAKYQLVTSRTGGQYDLVLGAGPKLPIGATNSTNNSELLLPADMQAGTGSWDAVFWSYAARNAFIWPNFSVGLISTYRLTGTNSNYGGLPFQFGKELQSNLALSNRYTVRKLLLDALLTFRYRHVTADEVAQNDVANTGGQWVYVVPGMQFNFSPAFGTRFSGDIPLYRKLVGTQLTTSFRFTFALQYTIKPKPTVTVSPTLKP